MEGEQSQVAGGGASRRTVLRTGGLLLATGGLAGSRAPSTYAADGGGLVDLVADFGAVGDGVADDSAAFAAAYRWAAGRVRGGVGRTAITLPPGRFLVTEPGALLRGSTPRARASGLRFSGAGKRITEVVFAPAAAGEFLCTNDDTWSNVAFDNIRFRSGTAGASFFYSYSTGGAADYRFSDCEWTGEWEYGIALDGSNTNSEMRWEACRVGGAYRKAFLYAGLSRRSRDVDQQDQFLNYWFTDMNVTYEWGNFLEFPYGGSITCRNGSYIVTGRRPAPDPEYGEESTFFRFPRAEHYDAVQRFHAEDIRFELRDPAVVVIDCHWSGGTVHFNDCDDTANAFKAFAADVRAHRYQLGERGPLVRYDSCQLVGAHRYAGESGRVLARYDMCRLKSRSQADFIDAGTGSSNSPVRFVDCVDASQ